MSVKRFKGIWHLPGGITEYVTTLGLITIEQRFGEKQDFDVKSFVIREKSVLVRQPIPKRPPDGLNLAYVGNL